jgi:hypothetical protein
MHSRECESRKNEKLTLVIEPTGTGSYLLRYDLPGEGIVYEEAFESLLVPLLAD